MAISFENLPNWSEIELSESYLVCGMFVEASSMAYSVLKRLLEVKYSESSRSEPEVYEMLESAGMVYIQSLKEIQRTKEIIEQMKELFGSVSEIPFQVFLTGVCFQIQEDPTLAKNNLEEFLGNWRCVDEKYYVLASSEENLVYKEGFDNQNVISMDKYLEVVEVYLTLLVTILSETELVLSWIEKTQLPNEKQQELLRRFHSIHSSKFTSSSSPPHLLLGGRETNSTSVEDEIPKSRGVESMSAETKEVILKLYGRKIPQFWWFRKINLKIGSHQFAISNGNIFLGFLIFVAYYYLRRKQVSLRRILRRQSEYLKKSVVELWDLAFSHQVNPLAAVQPISSATPAGIRH